MLTLDASNSKKTGRVRKNSDVEKKSAEDKCSKKEKRISQARFRGRNSILKCPWLGVQFIMQKECNVLITEMNNMRVSVIVPVYNVEPYLTQCIESVCNQSYTNLEIILVDDASSDASGEICDDYAQKDKRIQVIHKQINGGLSEARNTGMENATGKYILFVDSDDFISENTISVLYEEAEEKEVDIVYFNYVKYYDAPSRDKKNLKTVWHQYDGIYTGKEFFCATMQNNDFKCEVVRQFYKRDFLVKNKICFLKGILHEDILFSFYAIMEAQRVCNLNLNLYYYRQRANSITRIKDINRAQSFFVILIEILIYWKTHDFNKEESFFIGKMWNNLFQTYKYYQSFGATDLALQCGDEIEKQLYGFLNKQLSTRWMNVNELPLNRINKFDDVIIYGAGRAAKEVVEYLRKNQIKITRIMVNSLEDNPSEFCGIEVFKYTDCLSFAEKSIVIIGVTSKYSGGIEDMLKAVGFKHVIKLSDYK